MLFNSCKFVDLTHLITPNIPNWDNIPGFSLENLTDYNQGLRQQKMQMLAGIGTHMDSPSHFIKGGLSIEDIPLENLITSACVINVSEKADAQYRISPKDVEDYETQHGEIPKNSFVIGYTGWSRFWPDVKSYRNLDQKNQMQFPSFSHEAVQKLLEKEISGIGIDTLSPDCDPAFPVHHLLFNQGKHIVENMANCHLMPPKGAYVILLPLNVDSTESPVRAVGIIPKTQE